MRILFVALLATLMGCGSNRVGFTTFGSASSPEGEIIETDVVEAGETEPASGTADTVPTDDGVAASAEAEVASPTTPQVDPEAEDINNDGNLDENEDQSEDELDEFVDSKGAWILTSIDGIDDSVHLQTCAASAAHRYEAPTLKELELYREVLLAALIDLNVTNLTVWTADPGDVAGRYKVINLETSEVTQDKLIYGEPHHTICRCEKGTLGETCGGLQPMGTLLFFEDQSAE